MPPAALLTLALLIGVVGPLRATGEPGCSRTCSPGERCECQSVFSESGYPLGHREENVTEAVPAQPPPSCQNARCGDLQTCVLQQSQCVTAPCYPFPTCIPNRCAAVRCSTGTVCVTSIIPDSDPACAPFPNCRYQVSCVPRAKPKPGFCPPPEQVSQANVSLCEYDNDCPSNLLCCPGASRGGLSCSAPAFPDPCENKKCPSYAPTCVAGECRDRVCGPGNFFCRGGKQCFCSRQSQIECTDVPAHLDC